MPASDTGGEGDLAVAVYVAKKVPAAELAPEDLVPPALEISPSGGTREVPTRVIEQGEVTLETPGG